MHRGISLMLGILLLGLMIPTLGWASGDPGDGGDGGTGPGTQNAQQNFFRDDYTVDVDPSSGAFQASVPIKVPEFHGIEPALSLTYSSSGGNGFVGVGWSLSGISYIERITPGGGAPTYDGGKDTHALDGQEMVDNCNVLGGDYCTRIQNYKRIEQAGNNWVVTDKDGTKATYTPLITEPGTKRFRWAVDTVVDTHGNTVNYDYNCPSSSDDCYPATIKYNSDLVVITFDRESRTDDITFATGLGLRTMDERLSNIRVAVNGQQARRYRLVYLTTQNGERSKLDKIELRRDGGIFPADREFDYEDGSALIWYRHPYSNGEIKLNLEYLTGDFDGDGESDFFVNPNGALVSDVYTFLSDGDGSYTRESMSMSGSEYPSTSLMGSGHWFTGDLNGDGMTDMVHALNTVMYVWYATGSGGWSIEKASWSCSCTVLPEDFAYGRWASGDFNGDGMTDLVQMSRTSKKVYIWQSDGDASFYVSELDSGMPFVGGVGSLLPVDLNGDGNTDIAHIYNNTTDGYVHWWLSNGDFTFEHDQMQFPSGYPVPLNTGKWRAGDFNGDGNTDLLHISDTAGNLNIWYSHGGEGFTTQPVSLPPGGYPATNLGWWFPMNINGDGRTDLMHVATADQTLRFWESTDAPGTFDNTPQSKPSGYPGLASNWVEGMWQLGDTNGDSQDDLYHFPLNDADSVRTWRATGQAGNRLQQVTNRTGGTTTVAYAPSTQWPKTGYLPVGMVYHTVTSVTTDDGRGNTHEIRYEYEDGLWSNRERCFLGFGKIQKYLDDQDNYEDIRIRQVDNCTNRPETIYKRASDDKIFSYIEFEYDEEVDTPPYRALEARRNEHECNLINTTGSNCRQIRTETFYDAYANVTRSVEYGLVDHGPSDPPDERTTFRNYYPNTTLYIVDRLARERIYDGVFTTPPGGDPVAETRFIYDANTLYTTPPTVGLLKVRQDWDSYDDVFRDSTFDYYSNGNLKEELNPLSRGKSFTYETVLGIYPEDECSVPAVIPCTTTQWDEVLGLPTDITDPNGALTSHLYDDWGRIDLTTHADTSLTDYTYSGEGNPAVQKVEIKESDHTADDLLRTIYVGGFGREWKVEREGGDTKLTEYHENSDRIEFESAWYNAGDGESAAYREYRYDGAKRLYEVIEPYTDPEYPPNQVFWSISYNSANDGSTTRTDTLGKMRTTFRDGLGRTVRIREHDGAATYDTEYTYDVLDQLILVEDSLSSQTQDASFVVDSLGKTRTSCDFDIDQSQCRVLTYYDDGQIKTETNPRGQTATLTYDSLGRIKTKTTQEGELTTWYYDEPDHGASQGRLTRVTYPGGSQEFDWDVMGFQTKIKHCVGTGAEADCKSVDQVFVDRRLDSMTYPNADGATTETVTYGYDDEGFVSSVSGLVSDMTHDARGRVKTVNYSNGVLTIQNHDYPQDVLGDVSVSGPGGAVYQADYGYDAASQVKSISSTTHTKLNLGFVYDDLYRLKNVTVNQTQSFDYDRLGRLTTRDGITYAYDLGQHPHAVSSADGKEYAYDADGNLTSVTTKTPECIAINRLHSWDSESRLRWVSDGTSTTAYQYDHEGQRIQKRGPGGTARYFGNLLEVRDPEGTPTLVKYYYVEGVLLAMEEAGAKQWVHRDHLGSVRAISDGSGNRTVAYEYAAYGEQIDVIGSSTNVRGFGGHWRDDESALLYMGARYHDPALARFIQPDPVVPDPTDPQSWNRYSFVRNNPINRIDPTGRTDEEAQRRAFGEDAGVSPGGGAIVIGGIPGDARRSSQGDPAVRLPPGESADVPPPVQLPGLEGLPESARSAEPVAGGSEFGLVVGPGAGAVSTAARSASWFNRLLKSLASRHQMSEVGHVIAGEGSKSAFRNAATYARKYGGRAADWVKKSSRTYTARDGTRFETHWVENLRTGQRIDFKTTLLR
jgi:RHS repeat-associated protein